MTFTVKLDGSPKHQIKNYGPREFRDVWVYGSIDNRPSADVWVRNFEFDNLNNEDLGPEITKGN